MNIVAIYRMFPNEADCIAHLEKVRWNGVPVCPYCHSDKSTPLPKENRHHCNNCNTTYSVTVGTMFHHTHLPLQKWFLAISLMLNAKKGLSARQLARDLEVHRNTGWFLAMRIRKAMDESTERPLLEGIVEMDEKYVGGKPRKHNPNSNDGEGQVNKPKRGRGTKKIPVVGIVQRDGDLSATVVADKPLNNKTLSALVRSSVDIKNAVLITDEYPGYFGIAKFMEHETVNHQVWYVDEYRHTNTLESFWALLTRGIIGQYHKVSLGYLPQYVNEFMYRWNHRKNTGGLFALTLERGLGVTA